MPDLKKLTTRSTLTVPSTDDLLYIVNDPAGTPGSFKITVGSFFNAVATTSLLSLSGLNLGTTGGAANTITGGSSITIVPAAGSNFQITVSGAGDFTVNTTGFVVDGATGNVSIGVAPSASYRVFVEWATQFHRHKISNTAVANVANDAGSEFFFRNAATSSLLFAAALFSSTTITTGSEVGSFIIIVTDVGSQFTTMRIVGSKTVFGKNPTSTPVASLQASAPDLATLPFRVESVAAGDDPGLQWQCGYVTTTDGTTTNIMTIPITASRTYFIQAFFVARRTGGTAGVADDGATYVLDAAVATKAGVVTVLLQTVVFTAEDQAAWAVDVVAAAGSVLLRVLGAVNNNVSWGCVAKVSYMGS